MKALAFFPPSACRMWAVVGFDYVKLMEKET